MPYIKIEKPIITRPTSRGVMEIGQTIGIIMGSNIGTTLTAWLLSLTGIESENFFVNFLKPKNFSFDGVGSHALEQPLQLAAGHFFQTFGHDRHAI